MNSPHRNFRFRNLVAVVWVDDEKSEVICSLTFGNGGSTHLLIGPEDVYLESYRDSLRQVRDAYPGRTIKLVRFSARKDLLVVEPGEGRTRQ